MVMYDSLNRRMLPPYGNTWVHAPNFKRLAKESVMFENSYVGSMPCMPARRELHTGRYNFLHRSWGPIEPYDDSMPEILKANDIYTHLVSDHYHYWEDGGCTYHTRYNSWEISRGQEGDKWKGEAGDIELPESLNNTRHGGEAGPSIKQDWVNRKYMQDEVNHPQAKTFAMEMDFIHKNHQADDWFLQIETFDPHEPYFSYQQYKDLYPDKHIGPHYDWPPYQKVSEEQELVDHMRYENAALVSMCDHYLGEVLELMDKYNLWEDTMLIVKTDHGFLLGEHGWWAKCSMPFYNEIAHTPLFIWDPRFGIKSEKRNSLVQTIDIPATLLEYFNVDLPVDMEGKALKDVIKNDSPVRKAGLFGLFGAHINVTDGRYVYMRAPVKPGNKPLYEYTLMPTHHGGGRAFISMEELKTVELADPFGFTKGLNTLKINSNGWHQIDYHPFGTMLFDLENDPYQENPIDDQVVEEEMKRKMVKLMLENDAPKEQYTRLGLEDIKEDINII